jgi:hypothetical protein
MTIGPTTTSLLKFWIQKKIAETTQMASYGHAATLLGTEGETWNPMMTIAKTTMEIS